MKFSISLTNNYEFQRLYSKGKSSASPLIAIYCRKNRRRTNSLGFTVGKKVGNAVIRNRVRRKLYEIYRLNEHRLQTGYDIVIVARARAKYADYWALNSDFLRLIKKLELIKPTPSPDTGNAPRGGDVK